MPVGRAETRRSDGAGCVLGAACGHGLAGTGRCSDCAHEHEHAKETIGLGGAPPPQAGCPAGGRGAHPREEHRPPAPPLTSLARCTKAARGSPELAGECGRLPRAQLWA